jgi:peptidoglycan/xylan/chitin deacetylase (PgdA/CDA1 family)
VAVAAMALRRYIGRLFDCRRAPVILMFHRIADPPCDPWALSVSPARFEDQMRALKARRIPLSMTEFVRRLEDGTLPALAVAVTFDDGYVDNLRTAKPILEKFGVPATVFLTTGFLGQQKEFWWDELARLILVRREEARGTVVIGGRSMPVQLPPLSRGTAPRTTWRAWNPPRTARERLYFEVWKALQVLDHRARDLGLHEVRRLFGQDSASPDDFPMTPGDVRQLIAGAGIEIGAHTRTHPPLSTLGLAERRSEIQESRTACEALTGTPVRGFAYPHGDLDKVTMDLVRDSGFHWACSTRAVAVNGARFDLFNLPRQQVCNWRAAKMQRALNHIETDA